MPWSSNQKRQACRKYDSNKERTYLNIFNQEFMLVLKTPAESYIKPSTQTVPLITLEIIQNISRDGVLFVFVFPAESLCSINVP